jgi:ribose 5-phosphate isomerase B
MTREERVPVKLAIGSDHGGFELKEEILKFLKTLAAVEVKGFGVTGRESVDYPDFGRKVSEAVAGGTVDRGILICGTGIGMSIVANRYHGVRAALCHDHFTACMSREHNDANILVLGERVIGKGVALEIVKTWLETPFAGGRHQLRLNKISEIEKSIR